MNVRVMTDLCQGLSLYVCVCVCQIDGDRSISESDVILWILNELTLDYLCLTGLGGAGNVEL